MEFILTTPPGKGAIAVVTLYATEAAKIVGDFFVPRSGKAIETYEVGRIIYGTITEEDVIVCPISAEEIEIHCHGSIAAVERLKDILRKHGAVEISQKMWVEHHAGGRFQTENQRIALLALPGAQTMKIASILWNQACGAYEKALKNGENTETWNSVAKHLTRPWKVVMVGYPNVGKSSLFNRVLGFPRAMIYEKAGTTRDILRENTILNGWMVELIDTAGIHITQDPIEQEGIRRAREEIATADLILWVREPEEWGNAVEPPFPAGKMVLTVWNKADLLPETVLEAISKNADTLAVSALKETGIETLLEKITSLLVPAEPPVGCGMRLYSER